MGTCRKLRTSSRYHAIKGNSSVTRSFLNRISSPVLLQEGRERSLISFSIFRSFGDPHASFCRRSARTPLRSRVCVVFRAKGAQGARKHFCVDAFGSLVLHTVDVGVEAVFSILSAEFAGFAEAVQHATFRKAGPTGGGGGFSLPLLLFFLNAWNLFTCSLQIAACNLSKCQYNVSG